MKIRKLTPENYTRVSALLRQAFPGSGYEAALVEDLRKNNRVIQEWVCLHAHTVIACIAFSNAYEGPAVCGLHLAPLAVKPEFQGQGIGSELMRFALRQEGIRDRTIFVLGAPRFYQKFGFTLCSTPICPFDKKKGHFLGLRNSITRPFVVGYEPEFSRG
jgi:putative acetyltransferase